MLSADLKVLLMESAQTRTVADADNRGLWQTSPQQPVGNDVDKPSAQSTDLIGLATVERDGPGLQLLARTAMLRSTGSCPSANPDKPLRF